MTDPRDTTPASAPPADDRGRDAAVRGFVRLSLPPLRLSPTSTMARPEGHEPVAPRRPAVPLPPAAPHAATPPAPTPAPSMNRPDRRTPGDLPASSAKPATGPSMNRPDRRTPGDLPASFAGDRLDASPASVDAEPRAMHAANRPAPAPRVTVGPARTITALGLTVGIAAMAIVFAVALAMERHMHGYPPGMH